MNFLSFQKFLILVKVVAEPTLKFKNLSDCWKGSL